MFPKSMVNTNFTSGLAEMVVEEWVAHQNGDEPGK